MDFKLTPDQKILAGEARAFMKQHLLPISARIDEKGKIPEDFLRRAAQKKYLGITIPASYGGAGAGYLDASLVAFEIGAADSSLATAVFYLLEAAWGDLVAQHGTDALKNALLPEVVSGKAFLGVASSEPSGGSDVAAFRTVAEDKGGVFVIRGAKAWISGGMEACEQGGGHVTVVKTNPEAGARGISLIYVPADTKGVTFQRMDNTGRMGISTCSVTYKDAGIPKEFLIGPLNGGFPILMNGFYQARVLVAATCVGLGDAILEQGMERIKDRKAFGCPIGKFEGIQFSLADLYGRLEMVRLLVLKAAWMVDTYGGEDADHKDTLVAHSAASKLFAPQVAFDIVKEVMMWHGALGYTRGAGLERALRGILSYISGAEGALNIMRVIIARSLLGKEYIPYRS